MKRYTEKENEALIETISEVNNIGISIGRSEAAIFLDDGICPAERKYQEYLTLMHIYQYILRKKEEKNTDIIIEEAKIMENKTFLQWVEKKEN